MSTIHADVPDAIVEPPSETGASRLTTAMAAENVLVFVLAGVVALWLWSEDEGFAGAVFGAGTLGFLVMKMVLGQQLSFTRLSIPAFFMGVYFLTMSRPSLTFYRDMKPDAAKSYLLAIHSVLITFPAGVLLASLFFDRPKKLVDDYWTQRLEAAESDLSFMPIFYVLLSMSIPCFGMYFFYAEHIPIVDVWNPTKLTLNKDDLRFAENELPKLVHFSYEALRRIILPVCLLFAYLQARVLGGKWWFMVAGVALLSLLAGAMTLDRAPVVVVIFMVVIASLCVESSFLKALSPKALALVALGCVLGGFVSVLQYQRADELALKEVFDRAWYVFGYRIMDDAAFMCSLSFENFNDETGFMYGRSLRILSVLPSVEYIESRDFIEPFAVAPVSFVGDLWRNFGWPGVVLGSATFGFIYQAVQLKFFRYGRTVLSLTFLVLMLCGSVWIIWGKAFGIVSTAVLVAGGGLGLWALSRTSQRRPEASASIR
jgi:oligosaccharide repeat unit polymerase